VMMKQQKDLWNVFLAGRVEFFSNRIVPARSPFFKTGSSESSGGRVWSAIHQAIGDGAP
jgi:hypothetical protein